MKPALRDNHPAVPSGWHCFRQGHALASALEQELEPWLQKIFGYYLLKIGDLSSQLSLPSARLRQQLTLGSAEGQAELPTGAKMIAEPDALPIAAASVDAVLLSHCLEFQSDPHHVIREAHRVLIGDGYLLLSGFNPHSVVGLTRFAPWLKNEFPWQGHFFSAARIKDWLHLIGFEVVGEQRFFCSSMLSPDYKAGRWQRFSERHLRYFASSYLLVARKRELPLTPIRPKWQVQTGFSTAQGISARHGAQRKSIK
ncbi:class I SAM-dependent methyltransferase [Alishewanella sp. SMS8]|uniref:class I SAM-dependent methyltransferase n=1 Tax=Alishewanella sp. SMS8 TaxID=2994676 RepID=UPI0027421D2A|nr:methyltransferase domain-containing protein [Alishewanella sp. SMS8]MDP4944913.1 class I SAM-dependent methyltransferase [Alishewanella sp.]MDP5458342.1 methyltransferase domain-containing protein [Alishewanella sp. SMS8]